MEEKRENEEKVGNKVSAMKVQQLNIKENE